MDTQSVLEKYGLGDTASDETPPVPKARKAPDGEWYIDDPARPGKYLRVTNHAAVLDSYGLGDSSVPKQPLPASMRPPGRRGRLLAWRPHRGRQRLPPAATPSSVGAPG
jgi:hypothetical protein